MHNSPIAVTKYALAAAFALLFLVPPSMAQDFVHQHARPGRVTIQVFIWGQVGVPGVWRVEPDIDLIELLSVARVPGVGVDSPEAEQRTVLRLYREEGGLRSEVYSEQLDRIVGEGGRYPTLQDGDILEVITTRRNKFSFQFLVQLVGSVSALTLLVLRIRNL